MSKTLNSLAAALLLAAPQLWAATPASGDLNDTTPKLEWQGAGPYVFTNLTPTGGAASVVCEPSVPPVCDEFQLNVDLSEAFRDLPENQRESVRVAISFPMSTGQEDYDLYLYDAAGTLVGESATGGQEAITVPLRSLKNGSYTVTVIPYAPLGTNYSGLVQVGKDAGKSAPAGTQFGGAFGLLALLGLLGAALRRR